MHLPLTCLLELCNHVNEVQSNKYVRCVSIEPSYMDNTRDSKEHPFWPFPAVWPRQWLCWEVSLTIIVLKFSAKVYTGNKKEAHRLFFSNSSYKEKRLDQIKDHGAFQLGFVKQGYLVALLTLMRSGDIRSAAFSEATSIAFKAWWGLVWQRRGN